MKNTAAALLLFALGLLPASAGDDAVAPKSPYAAPLPAWNGFYAGVNAGGFWNSASAPTTFNWSALTTPGGFGYRTDFATISQPATQWATGPGFIGGGQIGYNFQLTERVVVGVETDFQGVAGGGNSWNTGWMSGASPGKGPGAIGTVRGRAGYLIAPNLQIYGTGGFAYSNGN
jgi:outer membrane immunogenic protein